MCNKNKNQEVATRLLRQLEGSNGNRIVARPATDAGEWREAKPMTVSLGRRCCAWTPYYMLAAISTTTMFFGACSTCWRGAKSQPRHSL